MAAKKLTGKFLAYVLRHNPAAIGLKLERTGWADVGELLEGLKLADRYADMNLLEQIVATDDKGRFSFNTDKSKIIANQGHSADVCLELQEKIPPEVLYHGTAEKYIDAIMLNGIEKRTRKHVHLSLNEQTAVNVGSRHGRPVVLKIDAARMYNDGYKFYLSANGVWLTEYVPVGYIVKI